MKTKLMMFCLVLGNWAAYAQHDHAGHDQNKSAQKTATFKDAKVGAAYGHYIHLKDALVASNADQAQKSASDLQKSLRSLSDGKKTAAEAAKVAATAELEEQREAFTALSNEMKTLVKRNELASGTLYVEYCPMANNNTGGSWLSKEKEIKNPYFGDKMLKCGSVKETIQ